MSGSAVISLLVVDDHAIVRSGLIAILQRYPEFVVAGEAPNGEAALELWARLRPDVTLMDLVMPVLDGWQAIDQIRRLDPNARIIAISSFASDQEVKRALNAGASAYLLKDTDEHEFVAAIRGC